ncbi:MAG: serine/threonine protein kinase with repeat [Deltaproteobacteria bacterium]|nr:serine/threonine protein kinase with repeat [Deltaproteobacteria bacterium]
MEALRERFGKYHVLEKIAQGGMAEVYKVKTVGIAGFEKIQALKRILPRSAREGRFIRSFIDEARIAVELTHRNIVQVFDFGKADGELFLAMELIEGKDLRTALGESVARQLPPSVPVAAYIIAEVAQGLDYAHRKTDGYGGSLAIVHCDVSPANVMLSTDGYVKILDFGIARATFASALERRRLRGKPRYMAPEQTVGDPPTAAADVFALGIIAWELLTGLPLFRGATLNAILEAVRQFEPPRVDTINHDVPLEIVNAVATALAHEPVARGTAADLAAACARTAMAGGAGRLAAWLTELEQRPDRGGLPWQPDVNSINVPVPGAPGAAAQRDPYAARSVTASLTNVPAPMVSLREGSPYQGDRSRDWSLDRPMEPSLDEPLGSQTVPRPHLTPAQLLDAERNVEVRADREVTMTTPHVPLFPDPASSGTELGAQPGAPRGEPLGSVTGPRYDEPTWRTAEPWNFERTLAGVAKLADALPPAEAPSEVPPGVNALPSTVPFPRPSYEELELEPDPVAERFGDEPIDDDLDPQTTAMPAERRRAVVVAAVLGGAAGPVPGEVLRPITRSLGELAYQRGGVVTALDDHALVVAFGLEIAGEDDLAVAMGWALDAGAMARDVAADFADQGQTGIELRVGARAGVVTTTGEGAASVPQDAIDEARALAREATPDRPLFMGNAGRLTSGLYSLREVPNVHWGSPTAPVSDDSLQFRRRSRVLEVIGPRGFDERDRARLERRGKFVGRMAQLGDLEIWLQRAISADRRFGVLIVGAAGTGKSRLVAELVARHTSGESPLRVVTTAASPASRLAPFALVIDLYQAALGLPPGRGRAARRQVLDGLLHLMGKAGVSTPRARAIATDLDRAMELCDGISVGASEVADLRPRLAAGLAVFRGAIAQPGHALCTVIEDVHQADSASLEVLRHLLAVPAQGAELLVLTARPEGADAPVVDAAITIGDLVGGELRALIADRLGDVATAVNIAAVLARSGGNPLFIEELAQAVRDAGPDGEEVPSSAREVVSARIERLSAQARAALHFASVLGGTVRVRLLEELLGEASVQGELDELVEAGCLVRPEAAAGSSEGELQFARGLVREVVYDSLSARAQREGHGRVGRLLASRFFAGREEPPATIAEHLERGGELAGAAAFWLRAGGLALAASDAGAAVACFTRTLVLERELDTTPQPATARARRRAALAGREEAHRLQGDLGSDPLDLDDLQQLCDGKPARLADVSIRRAHRMLRLGDYANASAATVIAEEHATMAGDDRLRGEALRVRGEILERLGRFDEALAVIAVARDLFHRQRAIAGEAAAMLGRGRIHLLRAHCDAARHAFRPVLSLIEKTGDPWLERIVTNQLAVIEMCLGNFTQAMASAQRSLELCRHYGDRAREGDGMTVAGMILLELGLYDQAATTLDLSLEILSRTASRWSRADCLIYAGICDGRRGRLGGLALIEEALEEARRLGARYLEAKALVTRAGAKLRRGDLSAAIEDAADGVVIAQAATLVGYEIKGLAYNALAFSRLGGRHAEASAIVHRVLSLLDQQRHLDGGEEEVLAACVEVLQVSGASEQAAMVHERGRASVHRKLHALIEPAWKAAYAAIPEIAMLLR